MAKDLDFIAQLSALSYDPFFVIDGQRRITHFNDPFALMLGVRPAQRRKMLGSAFEELFTFDATGQACIAESLRTDGNVRVQSVLARTRDGRELVLDVSALPLRDDAGRVTGVLVLQRDVTDEQRLKERYSQEKQEHLTERESLLRIISDRDSELRRFKKQTVR